MLDCIVSLVTLIKHSDPHGVYLKFKDFKAEFCFLFYYAYRMPQQLRVAIYKLQLWIMEKLLLYSIIDCDLLSLFNLSLEAPFSSADFFFQDFRLPGTKFGSSDSSDLKPAGLIEIMDSRKTAGNQLQMNQPFKQSILPDFLSRHTRKINMWWLIINRTWISTYYSKNDEWSLRLIKAFEAQNKSYEEKPAMFLKDPKEMALSVTRLNSVLLSFVQKFEWAL